MIRLPYESFAGWSKDLPPRFTGQLDETFDRIFERSDQIPFVVRTFVDATSGAVTKYLPPIATNPDKDYYFVKIDSSVNAVTITPSGTNTIEGASSLTLSSQYASALLIPHNGVWYVLP